MKLGKFFFVLIGMMLILSKPGHTAGQPVSMSASTGITLDDHRLDFFTSVEYIKTGNKITFGFREVGARYPEGFTPEVVSVSENDLDSVSRISENEKLQIVTNLKLYPYVGLNDVQVEWILTRARTYYRKYIDLKIELAGDEGPEAQQALEECLRATKKHLLLVFSSRAR